MPGDHRDPDLGMPLGEAPAALRAHAAAESNFFGIVVSI